MTSNKTIVWFLAIALILQVACRKSEYYLEKVETVTDQGGGTGTVTWSNDKSYLLDGLVFVNDGQTLTIEPGTVIRARTGQGSLSSALIIARGGTIVARGEKDQPIIFTVEGDDLEGSVPMETRGLWGGVVILGRATVNTESGEDMIEGIPVSEPRGVYGGFDDNDNSGVLTYVSIRHGGTNIGEGNEINGLTLGGVGRQTVIDHVEVISNADDGVEFFGGAPNCRNMVVAYCGDDAYDMDQGFHGKGQFWLGVNSPDSDRLIEVTGGLQPVSALPGNQPQIYNATLVAEPDMPEIPVIHFSEFGGGHIWNSIVICPQLSIAICYSGLAYDSYALFQAGKLSLGHNILHSPGDPDVQFYTYSETGLELVAQNKVLNDSIRSWDNTFNDPGIELSGREAYLPQNTEFNNQASYTNPWFEQVTYKGAFGSRNWIEGWTLIHQGFR